MAFSADGPFVLGANSLFSWYAGIMNEHLAHYAAPEKTSSNRTFGLVFCGFFLVVGLKPLLHGFGPHWWALLASVIFLALALVAPRVLSPLNRWWTKLGGLMHRVISPVILGIFFYGIITPVGLLMRLTGNRPLRLNFDKTAASYWIARAPAEPAATSFKNQF